MWNATIKGLLSHKLRLLLTALAIVLGVSFVSGTYVLTDTMKATFTDLFQNITKGTDVVVHTRETFGGDQGDIRDPMPESLLKQIKGGDGVKGVDGVKVAEGSVNGFAQFVGKNGKPVTTGGAPTLGVSVSQAPELNSSTTLRSGQFPSGPDQVVVDARTASKQGFKVGDRVRILLQGPARTFTVSGIVGFGEADNLGGATLAGFELKTAQQVLNRPGKFDEIDVVAQPGVGQSELRDRISAALPAKYEAVTGADQAKRSADDINQALSFFTTALLAFAGIALFVGAFLIFNTFSIIVAQRTRELALLRCLGASRRQVLGSVLLESGIVGLVASLAGLGLGVVLAIGLRALLNAFGIDLPTTSTRFELRTVIVSLLIGVVVTLVSSFLPALKATRVPPVAAMRDGAATRPARSIRRRSILGSMVTLIGVGLLMLGLFRDTGNRVANVGAGVAVIFLGVAVLSPLIARPMASWIGWPFARVFRLPGNLARENAMRNPRRTASTAAALMIGVALVSFAGIFVASAKASFSGILDKSVVADYILTTRNFQGFSPELAKRLAGVPEVQAVTAIRNGGWKLNGKGQTLSGVDPAAYDELVRTETTSGSITALQSGGVAVLDTVAKDHGWKVGSVIPMEFPRSGVQQESVKAIYKDNSLNGSYMLSLADYQKGYSDQLDSLVIAKARPGADVAAARAAVDRVAADFPNVRVQDQAQYKADTGKQLDQLLNLVRGLLFFAIVIALFGIVNTLALSVYERVRELGLLRAVGATRRQLRSMIRWEAVIIAVLGAVLGLVLGVFFGWAMSRALASQGFSEFAIPSGQLVLYVVLAALAGILAAILPGRRAARVDMLRAITTE
jgi:putative ABC transport system permease protein